MAEAPIDRRPGEWRGRARFGLGNVEGPVSDRGAKLPALRPLYIGKVFVEPASRQLDNDLQRSRLLEQVAGARNNLKPVLATQAALRGTVESEHLRIFCADDQESRGLHETEDRPREIGPAASRHDGGDLLIRSGSLQGGRGAGAGPEITDGQGPCRGTVTGPAGRGLEPVRQQRDIEDIGAVLCLLFRQKIEQKRGEASLAESIGDKAVAGAQPTAPAAVSKNDQPFRRRRQVQRTLQPQRRDMNYWPGLLTGHCGRRAPGDSHRSIRPRAFQWLVGAGLHTLASFESGSVAIHVRQQLLFHSNPAFAELFCPRKGVGCRRIPRSPQLLNRSNIFVAQVVQIKFALAEASDRLGSLGTA